MAVEFTLHRSLLQSSLERVVRVVEKRNTVPILNNVLISAEADGRITVSGTDMQILATVTAEGAKVVIPGTTCVEADLLLQALKRSVDGPVTFEASDTELILKAGRSRSRIPLQAAEDYPIIPIREASHRFTLYAAEITQIIEKCVVAITAEENRHYLDGIYLHATDDHLIAVATDGKKFAKIELERPEGAEGMPGIIIPTKMVRHLPQLVGNTEGPITVALSNEYIRFEVTDFVVQSRLVDGVYPDYPRFLPPHSGKVATVSVAPFKAAADRMLLFAPDKYRDIRCDFSAGKIQMHTHSDRGDSTDEVEADCDFDMTIGFNGKILAEILGTFDGETTAIELTDQSSGVLFTDPANDRHLCLVMPVAVKA